MLTDARKHGSKTVARGAATGEERLPASVCTGLLCRRVRRSLNGHGQTSAAFSELGFATAMRPGLAAKHDLFKNGNVWHRWSCR